MTPVSAFRLTMLMAACAVACWAHHSFAAEFDAARPVRLTGVVSRLEWTNPHTLIYLTVKSPDGKTAEWMVEAAAPNAMMRRGIAKEDFRPGAVLTVNGERSRDGWNRMNGESVTLGDGRCLPLRYSPAGAEAETRAGRR